MFNDALRNAGFDENYRVNQKNQHVSLVNKGRKLSQERSGSAGFDDNYSINWGNEHVSLLNQGKEVQLSLDRTSGGGFKSKKDFASGFFKMKIKLPSKDTAGVVTAFYVPTNALNMFFIDDIPIRVYNNTKKGVGYPTGTMQVVVSLWDGSEWATDGGKTKADYANAPFQAHFQDFTIDGCASPNAKPDKDCYDPKYWWNCKDYWQLNPIELKAYEEKKKYINYDYCTDKGRYPTPPPECVG
ncbi:hypothetical protein L6452_38006 [Arctium lappa]|uniref:Uncharacterized protein n=1 Tax=Arctium lappa TaxID=4217 RepID=A0ACB8Y611_ARCLA|nr:hypothetical protein L6452_38006 [Arctium lappa]